MCTGKDKRDLENPPKCISAKVVMLMMIFIEYLVYNQDGKTSSVTRCLRTGKQQGSSKCTKFDNLTEICENDDYYA